ncbi:hypothetical protein AYI69_g5562, partial [Smittium culicis]
MLSNHSEANSRLWDEFSMHSTKNLEASAFSEIPPFFVKT